MKPLRIDFAAPSVQRGLFHLHPALLVAAVLGLLLCLGAAVSAYQLVSGQRGHAIQARLEQERQEREVLLAKAVPALSTSLISPAQAAAVNGTILQLNLPWRELKDAVAAATPTTVALLALEPDAKKHVLKLTAETETSDDMIAYIQQLKAQEFFRAVLLTRHEINAEGANQPIRFQIEVQWVNR